MKTTMFALFAAVITLIPTGCSFLARGEQIIAVSVTPTDSYVIANGTEYHNLSPMFIQVSPKDALLLTVYKPGYRTVFYAVDSELSKTGMLDACGAIFILPAAGLLANGAWRFPVSNININLEPLPDPEESVIEQEATQKKRQETARELLEQTIKQPAVPVTNASAKTSVTTEVKKDKVGVTIRDPQDIAPKANPDEVSAAPAKD